jgi:hypothetical protein
MGMGMLKNEVGNRYGLLTVLGCAENSSDGRVTWSCECDCGSLVVVR